MHTMHTFFAHFGWALFLLARFTLGRAAHTMPDAPLGVICGDMATAMGRVPHSSAQPVDDDELRAA